MEFMDVTRVARKRWGVYALVTDEPTANHFISRAHGL